MSIFICWSGERSHKLADEVKVLLRGVFPKLPEEEIFVSDNIEKGVNWFQSVVTALKKSRAGIVCLTAENLDSPWMHFEAGALASGFAGLSCVDGRADSQRDWRQQQLFTLLHGVTGAEVKGPLGAYQATATTRLEMEQMVQALARLLGPEHNESITGRHSLISAEDWKDFEKAIEVISVPARDLIPDLEQLFQRKTFNEPLYRCSDLAWLRRSSAAR